MVLNKLKSSRNHELTDMLDSEETVDRLVNANRVGWHWHVMRKGGDVVLKRTSALEVVGRRERG